MAGRGVYILSLLHELHASHTQYTDALLFHHLSVTTWEYLTGLWGEVSLIQNIWAFFPALSLTTFVTSVSS